MFLPSAEHHADKLNPRGAAARRSLAAYHATTGGLLERHAKKT